MTVEVVEKKRRGLTCGECGETISKGETCEEHPDAEIKKSLTIIRKSVADTEDELEDEEVEDEADEDDEVEDELEEEDEDELDDDEDDEDDEDEDEDEEDEDEDEEEPPVVKKSLVGLEALNISTALAEDIAKVFSSKKPSRKKYENVMLELNNVMDSAADNWFAGGTVSKSSKKAPHVSVIRRRVNGIIKSKEGKKSMARPDGLDLTKLDDKTRKYIEELEGGDVEKSNDPYKGLPKEVRKSLKDADEIVEKSKQDHWLEVAKGYSHIPGNDTEELAKTLRTLSENSPEAFTTLKKSLDAAEESLKTSEVFKSYGRPGGGESKDAKHEEEIRKVQEAEPGLTREQAEVRLMGADNYRATA